MARSRLIVSTNSPSAIPLFQHLLQVAAALGGAFARHLVVHRRVKLAQVVQQPLDDFGVVHHAAQHHEHRFEHVARMGAHRGALDAFLFEIAVHRQVEQPLLVAEQFVERPFRDPQLLRDVVHAHRLDALRDEHVHRLFYDSFLLIHDPIRLIRIQIYAPKLT